MVNVKHHCLQEANVEKLKIDSAVLQTQFATMRLDITDIKKDLRAFIESADVKYATKKEVADLKLVVGSNTNKIVQVSEKVAQWTMMIAILAKMTGLW
jgi:hypothetical protein